MDMRNEMNYIKDSLSEIGIDSTDTQINQLYEYYQLVLMKNTVMNLTAITEFHEFVIKHFVDSLMIFRNEKPLPGSKLVDIGTGAGFPGIPIKILFPELEVLLIDSLNKRILFLQDVIAQLNLKKIQAIHSRAEEPARKNEYREKYDYCVSRAVANMSTLAEYCLPYVRPEGEFISYKSGKVEEELKTAEYAISQLGGKVSRVDSFVLPGTDMERTLIHVKKEKTTPMIYPRNAGRPSKEPLHN